MRTILTLGPQAAQLALLPTTTAAVRRTPARGLGLRMAEGQSSARLMDTLSLSRTKNFSSTNSTLRPEEQRKGSGGGALMRPMGAIEPEIREQESLAHYSFPLLFCFLMPFTNKE